MGRGDMNIMKKDVVREKDWYSPNDGEALVLFYIRYAAGARRPGWLCRFMKKSV